VTAPRTAVAAAVVLAVAVAATVLLLRGAPPAAGAGAVPDELVAQGRELFLTGCSSCHGIDGAGSGRGPSLEQSGEAGAYYYLSTGRMPLANTEEQPRRKDPAYDDEEIEALVAFVGSLGDGPAIPEVDAAAGDLAHGGEVYREMCAPCHSAGGIGGALSYGRAAPTLRPAEPRQIGAAVRTGPGQMPVFDREAIDDEELDDVVRYVRFLDDPEDRGGFSLGNAGPIPEGAVAWIFGVGLVVLATLWIGKRQRKGDG
jgi:ubiquinol-cytochrome c reductase cytochrome c subunit